MSKESYKVLHIFSSYGGGISSLVLNLIENKSQNFNFDIMAFSYKNGDAFLERIRKMGGEAYQMPRPRIDGYVKFKRFVDNVLSENNYDAVHCHITGWHAKPFVNSAKKYGVKCFIFHAHTTKYDSRIDRVSLVQTYNKHFNYKCSEAYMTCSDMAANYIYGETYLRKRAATLVPNGINEKTFANELSNEQRVTYRKELHIPDGAFVVGYVGRFSMQKNLFFILDIVNELKKRSATVVFVLVGTGELFDSVKEKAETDGLLENIRFLGRRTDISSLMQFFDIMILPSFYEGLPTVAVECQAAGTRMFLANTITRQCDMKLNLLEFLPINNAALWADAIQYASVNGHLHLNSLECLEQIRSLGFTAKESGKLYCSILKKIIEENVG